MESSSSSSPPGSPAAQERTFLHDLSNPLSAVFLTLEAVSESLATRLPADAEEVQQIKKAIDSLTRAIKLIQDRRSEIIKNG